MTKVGRFVRTGAQRRMVALLVTPALVGAIVVTPAGTTPAENAVLEWNQYALDAGAAIAQGPLPQMRALAIIHVAMNDAVQAIAGGADTYLAPGDPPDGASAEAAAIAAAHATMTALYGDIFDDEFANSLATRSLSESDPGVGFGESIAAALLALRSTDGASVAQYPYTAPGAGSPGVWEGNSPTSAALPGWGDVDPWVLQSGSQFRPDAPPSLESGRWARDYNEVKDYGSVSSTVRSALQSDIARFWLATPSAIFNPLARQVIEARNLDLSETARTLALMYMAGTDASIACWDAKYTYNFWRPLSAIRRGDTDGNDATEADPTWTPFLGNPQHPEYLSGHSTASSAMAAALTVLFGDSPGITLIGTSPTKVGFEREWSAFSEAVDEVIDARIYGGFHFRTSDETGARVGRMVARFVVQHALDVQKGKPSAGSEPTLGAALRLETGR